MREALLDEGIAAAEESLELLNKAAHEFLGDGQLLSGDIAGLPGPKTILSKPERFERLMRVLTGRHALDVFAQISRFYEELFFLEIVPNIYADTKIILAALKNKEKHGTSAATNALLEEAISGVETGLKFIENYRSVLAPLSQEILVALKMARDVTEGHSRTGHAGQHTEIDSFCGLKHDVRNIMTILRMVPEAARQETVKNFRSILRIGEFDLGRAGALLTSVARLLLHEAARRGVRIKVEDPVSESEIEIPAGLQSDIFRLAFEATLNALRNSDPDKPEAERLVHLSAQKLGDILEIMVADSGVGMNSGRGERGTGLGLSTSMAGIAGKIGADINFQTFTGVGTTVTFLVPLSPPMPLLSH